MNELEQLLGPLPLDAPPAALPPTVPVLLPVALDQTYDYLIPDAGRLAPGTFVLVPFGPQVRLGVVWDRPVGPQKALDLKKMKAVSEPLDVPHLPAASMRFAEWVARYTLSELGQVVRMMMGAQAAFEPQKPRFGVRIVPGAATPPRALCAAERH
jgi:primosomal protein N' (replication factor Y)